jgi:hypothetical protein
MVCARVLEMARDFDHELQKPSYVPYDENDNLHQHLGKLI